VGRVKSDITSYTWVVRAVIH